MTKKTTRTTGNDDDWDDLPNHDGFCFGLEI